MDDKLNILKEIWYYYVTHSREEIDELWKEIKKENHLGSTCSEYEKFLKNNIENDNRR